MSDVASGLLLFLTLASAQLLLLGVVLAVLHRAGLKETRAWRLALELGAVLPVLTLLFQVFSLPALLEVPVLPAERHAALAPAQEVDVAGVPSSAVEHVGPRSRAPVPVPATAEPSPARRVDWAAWLGVAWWLGALLVLVRTARRAFDLRALLGRSRRVRDPHTLSVLRSCRDALGLRTTPRLLAGDAGVSIPFVTGLLRPVVVLPRRLLEPRGDERLRYALLHELAHLRYGDHLRVVPELLLRAAFFFHPVMHRVLACLQEERECRCDRAVARVDARRAAYADFLLDEIEQGRGRTPPLPAIALGRSPGSAARRIRRLLTQGESPMKHPIRAYASLATVFAAVVFLAGVAPGPVLADEGASNPVLDHRFDSINAVATDEAGLYQVYPVFEELLSVAIYSKGGPYDAAHTRELKAGEDYAFDKTTGMLRISVPVDAENDHVSVRGYRVLPWRWVIGRALESGSVKVTLGDREGKRGEDYETEEAAGTIRFLKQEFSTRKSPYSVSWRHPVDPSHPERASSGVISNRSPARRASPRPEAARPAPAAPLGAVGTNASATADPRRWALTQPMRSEGLRVAVAPRGGGGALRFLDRGDDFVYDPSLGTIVLSEGVALDPAKEYLFVHGTPTDRGLVLRHRAIGDEVVKVIVGERRLVEGEGYEVERAAGRIRILDAAIQTPRTPFYVQVGSWSFGDYTDRELLRRLLAR